MTAGRRIVAVISGAVLSFAYAPVSIWGFSIVAVTTLTLLLRSARTLRGAYLEAFLFGLGFFVPLLSWVKVPGIDAWLGLAVAEAAIFALIGPLTRTVARSRAWPLLAAAAWVAEEALRDRQPFGGFPWGRLAFSQAAAPTLRWASWGGAPLLTFVTALVSALLAAALVALWRVLLAPPADQRWVRRHLRRAGLGVAGAAVLVISGHAIVLQSDHGTPLRVAIIQGNVPRLGLTAFRQREAVLRNHVNTTIDAARALRESGQPQPDIYIWPENSTDIDPFVNPAVGALIEQAAQAAGRPILVGAVLDGNYNRNGYLVTVRNSAVVWNPGAPHGAIYVKRHPVPFGEYIPMRSVLGHLIGRLKLIPYDFEKGKTIGVLPIGPTTLGDVICFEVAYDGIVRDAIKGGGKVLVVQTNNATFGRSSETRQQLEMSQIRAVEHNRPVVVSATSGISAVISPRGTIEQRTHVFQREVLTATLPQLTSRTVADHVGEAPEWVLTGWVLLAFVVLVVRRPRSQIA